MEKMFTRKEAADILGIDVKVLDTARFNGDIAYVQFVKGGKVQFTAEALQEYIARSTHRARPINQNSFNKRHRR